MTDIILLRVVGLAMADSLQPRNIPDMRARHGPRIASAMATSSDMAGDDPAEACARGEHSPRRVPIRGRDGMLRSTCRICGCDLVRTMASRRWYYSGPLA